MQGAERLGPQSWGPALLSLLYLRFPVHSVTQRFKAMHAKHMKLLDSFAVASASILETLEPAALEFTRCARHLRAPNRLWPLEPAECFGKWRFLSAEILENGYDELACGSRLQSCKTPKTLRLWTRKAVSRKALGHSNSWLMA